MSYAVRNDGLGWRAVNDASECVVDETWQAEQPPPVQPAAHAPVDPVGKLKAFLAANPDVAAIL